MCAVWGDDEADGEQIRGWVWRWCWGGSRCVYMLKAEGRGHGGDKVTSWMRGRHGVNST